MQDDNLSSITVGAVCGGAELRAVHKQRDSEGRPVGVVLGYREGRDEWCIWRVNHFGELEHGRYTWDEDRALFLYGERVVSLLYGGASLVAPALTFEQRNSFD